MRRVRFCNEAARVQHQRVVGVRVVCFDFCQNRIQQIRMMNSRIQNLGWRPPNLAGDQSQPSLCVNWRFVFGEYNQRRSAVI